MIQRYKPITSLLFTFALLSVFSTTMVAQINYNEATDGDLPDIPPTFTIAAGTNTWQGTLESTPPARSDNWDIQVPSGVTLNSITWSGPGSNSSTGEVFSFSIAYNAGSAYPSTTGGSFTWSPSGGVVGPATINIFVQTSVNAGTKGWTVTAAASGTPSSTAPSITSNPSSTAVCAGATASFTAAASGTPTPTVQWQVNSGAGFGDIGGATGTTYSFATNAGQNGNQYRAVFSNSAGNETTGAATLTVNTAPAVTTQPTSQTVCEGYNLTLTAGASASPAASVQWQVNSGGGFGNIGGATSTTYQVPVTQALDGNQYRAVFTNTCGSATTNTATITVKQPAALDITLAPSIITSSSGYMQSIFATAAVRSGTGCSPTIELVSVTSSDPDAGQFAGDQANDIQGVDVGTNDNQFQVRAEIVPGNSDRTYEATYRVTDGTYTADFTEPIIIPAGVGTLLPGGTNDCIANFGAIPEMTGPTVDIPYTIGVGPTTVRITIFDTEGEEVAGLVNEVTTATGSHSVTWDGTNNAGFNPGTQQPNGYYLVLLQACNDYRAVAVLRVNR